MQKERTAVLAIGRWMPIHLGHKGFLVKLAKSYGTLIIGIGSCYENGTPRNCIPAVEREKLLRKMLKTEGIDNAIILPIEDKETFEEWINDVCRVCEKYGVTHFCTGNKEDILDVLSEKNIKLDVEMINPEDDSDFPYHATDIRNAILNQEWDKLDTMIPAEIKPMVLKQISKEIKRAAQGEGQAFIPGRQTVDLVFIVTNPKDGKNYLLIGKRNAAKIDFPGIWAIPGGGIDEFESPICAAIRCFLAETGIDLSLTDNTEEPALVSLTNLGGVSEKLHFIGIYASADKRINGSRGGGSQCFALHIKEDMEKIKKILHSTHDMDELAFSDVDSLHETVLAFDQKRMVFDALHTLGIAYDNGELLERFHENGTPSGEGVSRSVAHQSGIWHGASHTYACKRENGALWFLLQRRSASKDSYPLCLDISSAGHIEQGSNFRDTAAKEFYEELGLSVPKEDFIELFTQKIQTESEFRGKKFIDKEFNTVYLLPRALSLDTLKLQPSEVCEAVWMSESEILQRLSGHDETLCLTSAEFEKVLQAISEKSLL